MKLVTFIMDHQSVDCIIDHLKLSFVAERPPQEMASQDLLMAVDPAAEYFS